jgi:hypothetical protein
MIITDEGLTAYRNGNFFTTEFGLFALSRGGRFVDESGDVAYGNDDPVVIPFEFMAWPSCVLTGVIQSSITLG